MPSGGTSAFTSQRSRHGARPSFEIAISGREELNKLFNGLPRAIQVKALRPALRAGAKVLREFVRHSANASFSGDSGAPHVADTLKIKAMKRDRSKAGRIGVIVITATKAELGIDADDRSYYPAHVEYGHLAGPRVQGPVEFDETRRTADGSFAKKNVTETAAKRAFQASQRRHIPANPFMRRGLDAGRSAATRAIADELTVRLKRLAGAESLSDAEFFESSDALEPAEVA